MKTVFNPHTHTHTMTEECLQVNTLSLRGHTVDYQKSEQLWFFMCKNVKITASTGKKFVLERFEDLLLVVCFANAMTEDPNSVYNQDVYESACFMKECDDIKKVPVLFARQYNSHVRKQVHTLNFTQAIVHFPEEESWCSANTGKATLSLLHQELKKETLTDCVAQENELRDLFKLPFYNRTKRRRKL